MQLAGIGVSALLLVAVYYFFAPTGGGSRVETADLSIILDSFRATPEVPERPVIIRPSWVAKDADGHVRPDFDQGCMIVSAAAC
ncbi:hypothetical protein [Blastococcus saxobsidens]|uniref:hypothetical protein n=1 Tax=Blastococcus saxobsidens TaxID=138336 RepID=UPI00140F9986|nr:hypothetical protein [Blastococcus saxobsidens]